MLCPLQLWLKFNQSLQTSRMIIIVTSPCPLVACLVTLRSAGGCDAAVRMQADTQAVPLQGMNDHRRSERHDLLNILLTEALIPLLLICSQQVLNNGLCAACLCSWPPWHS